MYAREVVLDALELHRAGRTATEIARLIGVSRRTVNDWVRGKITRAERTIGEAPSCLRCGWRAHNPEELPDSYVYLLGVFLGDGCLSPHPRGVFHLRGVLDSRYPGILDEVEAAMAEMLPTNPVGRHARPVQNCVDISSYSKSWPCLLPQHGPGKKHNRPIFLAEWQRILVRRNPELLLRGLIHSDGHRFMNTGRGWCHPRYGFSNFSTDIRGIFCDTCDLVDLRWTWSPPKTIYVSRKADVARMDEFIGPKA
jgi:Homeodomain-like domain